MVFRDCPGDPPPPKIVIDPAVEDAYCDGINATTASGWNMCKNDSRCKVMSHTCNVTSYGTCKRKSFPENPIMKNC